MRKKLLLILLCMVFAISGACFAFAADATFTSVTLDGSKTDDGVYKSAITVKYDITDTEGIKEVALYFGDKKASTKSYDVDGEGNPLETLSNTINASQVLTKRTLAKYEPEEGEYALTVKVIDGKGNISNKNVKFNANVSVPKILVSSVSEDVVVKNPGEIKITVKDRDADKSKLNVTLKEVVYAGEEDDDPIEEDVINKVNLDASEGFAFTTEENGFYRLYITCIDAAGNKGIRNIDYYIDNKAPYSEGITFGGATGETGWFNAEEDVRICCDIYDDEQGLDYIKILINDILYKKVNCVEKEKIIKCTACEMEFEESSSTFERDLKEHKEAHEKSDEINDTIEFDRIYGTMMSFDAAEHPITKKWLEENASNDGKYDVKIIAVDNAGNELELKESFYADSVCPEITYEGIEKGAIVNTAPKITVKSNDKYADMGSISLFVYEKGAEEPCATRSVDGASLYFDAFKKDAEYYLVAKAKDYAGNESIDTEINFTLDTKAPVIGDLAITGHSKADGLWYDGKVDVETTITEATTAITSISVTINGKEFYKEEKSLNDYITEYTRNWEITEEWLLENASEDGKYDVKITSTDAAGNSSTKSKSFYADLTAPTVSISGITEGEITNKKPTIKATSGDMYSENGKVTLVIIKDGETYKEVTKKGASCTFKDFEEDGRYIVTATATDAAGNVSESVSKSFIYDTTAPQMDAVAIDGEKNEGFAWYKGDVTLSGDAAEALSGIANITVTVEGKTVYERAHANAEEPNEPAVYTASFTQLIDTDWIAANESTNGRYNVKVKITDRAGNYKVVNGSFNADIVAPTLALKGVENDAFVNENPKIKASLEDNYRLENSLVFDIDRDGKDFEAFEKKATTHTFTEFTDDGKYTVSVYAVDKAGNVSETKSLSFTKDTVAPVVTLSGAKEGAFYKDAKTVTVTIKEKNYENVTVKATMEKTLESNRKTLGFEGIVPDKEVYTKSKTVKETGTYTTNVTVTDAAGNRSEQATLKFTIDNTKPVIDIRDVAKENGHNARVTPKVTVKDSYFKDSKISLTRADGKAFSVKFTDTKTATGSKRTYSNFEKVAKNDGLYTLTCTAVDKAGNTETKKIQFAVNRFGSRYKISKESKELNEAYVKKLKKDIVITERNVTGLKEYQVTVTKDGIQRDVAVDLEIGQDKGWKTYKYTISKDLFKEEGVYTINITSRDTVGNFSEFKEKVEGGFTLYVDKTPPTISIDNIQSGKSYKGDKSIAYLHVNDAIHLSWYTVYSDNKQIFTSSEDEYLQNDREVIIPSGVKQTIKVVAGDAAGNVEEYVLENVTVSDNFFIRLWANKLLCGIIAVGLIGLIAGSVIYIKRRRGIDYDEEDYDDEQ